MATYSITAYQQITQTLSIEKMLGWTGGTVTPRATQSEVRIAFSSPASALFPGTYTLILTGLLTFSAGDLTGGTVTSISGQDGTGNEHARLDGLSIDILPLFVTGPPFALLSPDINVTMAGADTLTGLTQADTISGYGGADSIVGAEGDDSLSGMAGRDTIGGGDGVDRIFGGLGNDSLSGGLGGDFIYGEQDDDFISGDRGRDVLWGDLGMDTLYGNADDDLLFGGGGDDSLFGGEGVDTLHGDAGDDTLYGGADNDGLKGGKGINWLYGEGGDDVAESDFDASSDVQNISFDGGEGYDRLFITTTGAQTSVAADLSVQAVELIDFTTSVGQTVTLTARIADSMVQNGFEISSGLQVDGSAGAEKLVILLDVDSNMGVGIPTPIPLDLRNANFTNWTPGVDGIRIEGGYKNDFIIGSAQNDVIIGGDIVELGASNDVIVGGLGADSLYGGIGDDLFRYYTNPTSSFYSGSTAGELIDGEAGNDVISVTESGAIDFSLAQIRNVETLTFVAANGMNITATFDGLQLDTFSININRISVTSLEAAITLRIVGSYSDMTAQTFQFWSSNDLVSIPGTTGADRMIGSSMADLMGEGGNEGNDTLSGYQGNDTLIGGLGADSLDGYDGEDSLVGGEGNDTLEGGESDDNLQGGAGADSLVGGTGFDIVRYDDSWGVQVDILYSNGIGSFAAGDTFSGIEGVSGSNTDDGVWGTDGNNTIFTWLGNDYIDGRGGADVLLGGQGNDTLVGGAGGDYLAGEAGADVFRYLALTESGPSAQDYLPDFSSAQGDKIDVSAFAGTATFNSGFGTGTSVYAFSQGGGAWTMVQMYQGTTLHLQIVVNTASLSAGDFIL